MALATVTTIGCSSAPAPSETQTDTQARHTAFVTDTSFSDMTAPVAQASPESVQGRTMRPAQQPGNSGSAATQAERTEELQRLLDQAEMQASRLRYQEAEVTLTSALSTYGDLDNGTVRDARELLAVVRRQSGRSGDSAIAEMQERNRRLTERRSEALATIDINYEEALRAMNAGEFDKAQDRLSRALTVANIINGEVDVSSRIDQIRATQTQLEEERRLATENAILTARDIAQTEEDRRQSEQRNRFRERVRTLYEEAKAQFDRAEYSECIITLNQILWMDPYNDDVIQLREYCRNLKYQRRNEQLKREMHYQWDMTIARIDDSATPFVADLFEVDLPAPERWQQIEARAERVLERQITSEDPEVIRIKEQLRTRDVDLDYSSGATVMTIIDDMQEATGINMRVHPDVSGMTRGDITIRTQRVMRMSAENALRFIVDSLDDIGWYVEDGTVVLGTADEAVARNVVTRSFGVADLLSGLTNFPGERVQLDDEDVTWEAPPSEEQDALEMVDLEDLINEMILLPYDNGSTVFPNETQKILVVTGSSAEIEEVARLLEELRQSKGLMVTVEVRFVEVQDNFLEEIGIDYRGAGGVPPGSVGPNLTAAPLDEFQFGLQFTQVATNTATIGRDNSTGIYWSNAPNSEARARIENFFDQALGDPDIMTRSGGASFQFAFLDEVQLNAILRAVKKRERVNLVTAPKLTCFNTQRANITIRNQIAYIEDFQVAANTGVQIADPVVGTIEDGLVLEIRPVISSDRRFITIEVQPTIALLQRPLGSLTTTLGNAGSTPVTIQLPELQIQRILTTVVVPDGGSFMIGGVRRLQDSTQESGLPILSDIPILGNLFTRRGKSKLRSDLVIIVKAQITDLRELVDVISPVNLTPTPNITMGRNEN